MTIATTIINTLNTRLAEFPGIPNLILQNQGGSYVLDEINLSSFLLPADSTTATLDYTESHKGVYQVTISAPLNQGPAPASVMADSIADHFAAQRHAGNIRIRQISVTGGKPNAAWFEMFVSINYSVLHNRSV